MRLLNDLMDLATVAMANNSEEFDLDHMVLADITATIAGANPANKTFDTGTMEVQTLTFPSVAGSAAGDYVVFYDASGAAWAVSLNKGGADPEPTGAAWVAVAAANKAHVDISGGTDAASVAALVETAIDALTGLTAVITTDDTAANGTMLLTQVVPGPTTNPAPHNADDSDVGTILGVQTTAGVATEVSPDANTVTIPAHGLLTGVKITELTSTGTLPAGLSTGTVYYAIVVDANTIKFALTQADALAGTAVDITGYGTTAGVHTAVIATALAGTVKLQKNNEPDGATPIWVDITNSSTAFSAAGNINWALVDIGYRAIRAVTTVTSGTVTNSVRVNAKGG